MSSNVPAYQRPREGHIRSIGPLLVGLGAGDGSSGGLHMLGQGSAIELHRQPKGIMGSQGLGLVCVGGCFLRLNVGGCGSGKLLMGEHPGGTIPPTLRLRKLDLGGIIRLS